MTTFRLVTPADVQAFRALRLEALKIAPESFANTYANEAAYPLEKFIERLTETENRFTLGAFVEDKLVANCSFSREQGPFFQHKGHLMALYCQPAYQGTGLAQNLLTELFTKLANYNGLSECQLSVVTTNRTAIRFYEKFGFERYGTEKKALFDGINYRDEHLYHRSIKK